MDCASSPSTTPAAVAAGGASAPKVSAGDLHSEVILVTGASGYIGSHVCLALLRRGATVIGTVRDAQRASKVAHLTRMSSDFGGRLTLVEADLLAAESWSASVIKGCTLVCHVASPFVVGIADRDAERTLFAPARDGTTNVLAMVARHNEAAAAAEFAGGAIASDYIPAVRRVVVTSSMAAVSGGRDWRKEGYGETLDEPEKEWLNLEECKSNYTKSKGIAERTAWDFVATLKAKAEASAGLAPPPFELATILPTFVIGPPLSASTATSHTVTRRFLKKELPAIPDLWFSTVDVRDVAAAHCAALTAPDAAGERFACWAQDTSFFEWSRILSETFGPMGYKVPRGRLPKWIMRIISLFDKEVRMMLPNVGVRSVTVSNAKARAMLGVTFRTQHESIIDHAHGVIRHEVDGVVQTAAWKQGEAEGKWPVYCGPGGGGGGGGEAVVVAAAAAAEEADATPAEAAAAATKEVSGGGAAATPEAEEETAAKDDRSPAVSTES